MVITFLLLMLQTIDWSQIQDNFKLYKKDRLKIFPKIYWF